MRVSRGTPAGVVVVALAGNPVVGQGHTVQLVPPVRGRLAGRRAAGGSRCGRREGVPRQAHTSHQT